VATTQSAGKAASREEGGEALFAVLFIQSQVVPPIDTALDRAHGMSITGFEVLARLARMHPDGASVRYLSDQVVVSPSRVSRVVEDFVRRGLLERATSAHDGRLSLLRLTDSGRAKLAEAQETFGEAVQEHLLDRLSAKQARALTDVAKTLGSPNC
jgi:DNA-binding MarR family transcriptional regulator